MIWAKDSFTKELGHGWASAPAEQDWLKESHLHEFQVTVQVTVNRDDKEIVLLALRDQLSAEWDRQFGKAGEETRDDWSCEQLALGLVDFLKKSFPGRLYQVEVLENGRGGAIVGPGRRSHD